MIFQAKKDIYNIYSNLKRDKHLKVSSRFNNLMLYFSILERNKRYISKKEYKKLKDILNKELNSVFSKNRKLKSNYNKSKK